jgi:hypothetical protein
VFRFVRILAGLALLLPAAPGLADLRVADAAQTDRRQVAERDLQRVAGRIEELKRRQAAGLSVGGELEQLLVRSQELAAEIDRLRRAEGQGGRPLQAGPDPRELREQADLMRDRADRLSETLKAVDERIAGAKRERRLESRMNELADESSLFDEPGPRRIHRERSRQSLGDPAGMQGGGGQAPQTTPEGSGGAPAPGVPTGGDPVPAPPPPTAPTSGNTDPATSLGARPLSGSLPARGDLRGSLQPAAGDSERTLARKRAELLKAMEEARQRARTLDDEARVLEQRR